MQCSVLSAHLYNMYIIESPKCPCGHYCEDSQHYLLDCPLYTISRQNLFIKIRFLQNINLNYLLFGDPNLTINENKAIVLAVQDFIEASNRF